MTEDLYLCDERESHIDVDERTIKKKFLLSIDNKNSIFLNSS